MFRTSNLAYHTVSTSYLQRPTVAFSKEFLFSPTKWQRNSHWKSSLFNDPFTAHCERSSRFIDSLVRGCSTISARRINSPEMHVPRITRMQRQVTQPGSLDAYELHLVRRLTHASDHATTIFAFARGARATTYIYLWASFTANFDRRSLPAFNCSCHFSVILTVRILSTLVLQIFLILTFLQ